MSTPPQAETIHRVLHEHAFLSQRAALGCVWRRRENLWLTAENQHHALLRAGSTKLLLLVDDMEATELVGLELELLEVFLQIQICLRRQDVRLRVRDG